MNVGRLDQAVPGTSARSVARTREVGPPEPQDVLVPADPEKEVPVQGGPSRSSEAKRSAPAAERGGVPRTLLMEEAPQEVGAAVLLAGELREVLAGSADSGTAARVRAALLHRLGVEERTTGRLDPDVVALRQRLEIRPEELLEVLQGLLRDHPRTLAQHAIFADLDELTQFLGLTVPAELLPARRAVVVGGVHGNEASGSHTAWQIAREREQDRRVKVFPRANPWAAEGGVRGAPVAMEVSTHRPVGCLDLNRSFPGAPDPAELPEARRAAEIFEAAREADVAIDLHEARADWWSGRSGRLCMFYPNPGTLAFLRRFQPVLERHGFRLVPYRYPGTLVQEVGERHGRIGLLFELPLTLSLEERSALGRELVNEALDVAFNPSP